MTPLDLTIRPPRSPRALLDGFPMLARMIDRARSRMPGGNPGPYIPLNLGLSGHVLAALKTDADAFIAAVASAQSDDDVLNWLEERAGRAGLAAATEPLAHLRLRDAGSDDRALIDSLYPADLVASCDLGFDLLEADDARTFGLIATTAAP